MINFDDFKTEYSSSPLQVMSIRQYLDGCKEDPSMFSTTSQRMLTAIGEPETLDTSLDPKLSRLFSNRKINIYPAFKDFYGMEDVIEQVVGFFKHAAQGLQESKQILYLLGPVGAGKSQLAETLKGLIESQPFYALAYGHGDDAIVSPLYESPLGLFDVKKYGEQFEAEYGIPQHRLDVTLSPWAVKRLKECGGDLDKFSVIKVFPSRLKQIGVTKTEPGDDNSTDISTLVGKVDIRQLEFFSQDDPDAYSYTGGLNIASQGMLEFVEMFKAPIKMLNPLLTATQEKNYNGTQGFGAMPFEGIILSHSNESEWSSFKSNKQNEAFIDRVTLIKVPYCLRFEQESKIYKKMIKHSQLKDAPIAPGTYEMLAQFAVLSRLVDPPNSNIFSKLRTYNGDNLKDIDPKAKSLLEYKEAAGQDEGMDGMSTRFAYKILSKTLNYDKDEIAADPIHLMAVLNKQIIKEQFDEELTSKLQAFITGILAPKYAEFIGDELQKAFLEQYDDLGQNMFETYEKYADRWIRDEDFRDPDTGQMFDREMLNAELEKIEKPAGIANPKSFRNDVVNFILRERSTTGEYPKWTSYHKMKTVIEKSVFASTEKLLPILSFGTKKTSEEEKKHAQFVDRMVENGYTRKQVRLVVEWHLRYKNSN